MGSCGGVGLDEAEAGDVPIESLGPANPGRVVVDSDGPGAGVGGEVGNVVAAAAAQLDYESAT